MRGKWVLEQLLGTPPPPPPPDVPQLDEASRAGTGIAPPAAWSSIAPIPSAPPATRAWTRSASASRTYDAIGRWRTTEGKFPIDPSGTLPNGKSFAGAGRSQGHPPSRSADLHPRLTDKMLTYALGRGLESYDRAAVAAITQRVQQSDYRFSALIHAHRRQRAVQDEATAQ